jgi:hypothetical protein
MREITWGLATQRDVAYNPTYPFNEIQAYLNHISRYKQISYKRIANYNSARIKFLNMPVPVMQTDISKFTCKISSYFNFGRNSYWSARATCHEVCHMSGGRNHLPRPNIMAEDGGSVGNFTVADYLYLKAYPDKSPIRPWHEPNAMRDTFTPKGQPFGSVVIPEGFKCSCVDSRKERKVFGKVEIDIDDTPMFMKAS